MNLWVGCGRLVREPDLKYSSSKPDMAVCRYTLAIDRGYGEKKKTIFINCTSFGKAGEFASKYFHKGQRVLVQGEIDITEKDGKYYTNIIINSQEFADGKASGGVEKTTPSEDTFTDMGTDSTGDDDFIPF